MAANVPQVPIVAPAAPVPRPNVVGPGLPPGGLPADLHHVFTVIGLDADEMTRLMAIEHFVGIADLGLYDAKEIARVVSDYAKLPPRQRIVFGLTRQKRFQAVAFWVRRQLRIGAMLDAFAITQHSNRQDIIAMNLETSEEATTQSTEKLYPGKFDPMKCVPWTDAFRNFLDGIRGETGIPLSYIIRPEVVDPAAAVDDIQRMILLAPLHGPAYDADKRQVYRYLKNLLLGTEGWAWFEEAVEGDGREAYLNLLRHYNGPTEVRRRATEAEAKLRTLFYKTEATFPFEKYITKLKEYFRDLEDAKQGRTQWQMCDRTLEGIQSTDPRIISLVVTMRDKHPDNFSSLCSDMAAQIARIFPPTGDKRENKRGISATYGKRKEGGGKRQRNKKGGRGNDRAGRGGGGGRGRVVLVAVKEAVVERAQLLLVESICRIPLATSHPTSGRRSPIAATYSLFTSYAAERPKEAVEETVLVVIPVVAKATILRQSSIATSVPLLLLLPNRLMIRLQPHLPTIALAITVTRLDGAITHPAD